MGQQRSENRRYNWASKQRQLRRASRSCFRGTQHQLPNTCGRRRACWKARTKKRKRRAQEQQTTQRMATRKQEQHKFRLPSKHILTMFSWSQTSTKRNTQYPGRRQANAVTTATALEGSIRPPSTLTRAQHLESYLQDSTLSRSTRRVSTDDTTYDTVFQTTQGDTLIVRVHVPLASSFASFCPAMSLAGVRVRHDWVEGRGMRIVGYSAIENETKWKQSGLSLGQAVHAVVQHLQLNPPEILEITDAGLRAIQPPSSRFRNENGSSNGNASRNSSAAPPSYDAHMQTVKRKPQLPPAPEVPLPTIPQDFSDLLDTKSTEEIEDLLKNELDFLTLVNNLDVSKEIQIIAKSKQEETEKMARENLEYEEKLKSIRSEVESLKEVLSQKVKTFEALEKQQNALCAPPDLRATLRKLKEAKKEALDESDNFAEEWVEDGAGNVDQFVKEFVAKRKVHHSRAAKMEILQEQSKGR